MIGSRNSRRSRWRTVLAAASLLPGLVLSSGAVLSEDIRFCFNEWPPFVAEEAGVFTGISIDIVREAARRSGFDVGFRELPWNRCLHLVRTGEIDGVLDAAERPDFLQGPSSYSAYTNTFWVHADSDLTRFDADAITGRAIGLVEGYVYPPALMELMQAANVSFDYAVDDATNLRKLAFGRVDAIIADHASTLAVMRARKLSIRPLHPTHSSDPLYVSFHTGRREAHAAFDAAIGQLLQDGFVERVYRRHLGIGLSELDSD